MTQYTTEMCDELKRCSVDPLYFIDNYIKVRNGRGEVIPLTLYPAQANCLEDIHNYNRIAIASQRQLGMTLLFCAYMLWYVTFHNDRTVGLLLPKLTMLQEYIQHIHSMHDALPVWMRSRIVERTKRDMRFDNGSRIVTSIADGNSFKGRSINLLVWDLMGYGHAAREEECFLSLHPHLSFHSKTILCGHGRPSEIPNFFKKIFVAALNGGSFHPIQMRWWDNPNLDRKWKEHTISIIGKDQFKWEYESVILPTRY